MDYIIMDLWWEIWEGFKCEDLCLLARLEHNISKDQKSCVDIYIYTHILIISILKEVKMTHF